MPLVLMKETMFITAKCSLGSFNLYMGWHFFYKASGGFLGFAGLCGNHSAQPLA